MKQYEVVVPDNSGATVEHPMREWLRQNPHPLPPGVNVRDQTSQQLRGLLKRSCWLVEETPTECRMSMPAAAGQSVRVAAPADDPPEDGFGFGMEAQQRDFLAHNLP
jgi:hypothetical protein